MVLVDRHLLFFRYRRRWFARHFFVEDEGLVVYSQFLGRDPPPGWKKENFLTLHSALDTDREGHLARMKKNTAYEVKRAEKDGVCWEEKNEVASFLDYYNAFAQEKKLPGLKADHLKSLGSSLWMTRALLGGDTVAYHAYVLDSGEGRSRLLYSAGARFKEGADKAALGRANRWLHLQDMLRLQDMGIGVYDWGGIAPTGSDPNREGINNFKLAFGGVETLESHYFSPALGFLRGVLGKR